MQKIRQLALGAALVAIAGLPAPMAQSVSAATSVSGYGLIRLAERGDARAQTRLGFMLATGRGAPQNLIESAYWYRRAAEQGDPDAQYFLGECYDLGHGVPVDWILAHKWLNLSAARTQPGDERAHRARMRDAIASKLSREQVALAQELALAWRPRPER